MSRANSNSNAPRATRVAALHEQGGTPRLLVIEAGETPRILEAAPVGGDLCAAVADAHRRHGFGSIVRVAPARATIARTATIPAAGADETASALALLAEAQLPGSLPAHRRAAGLIADGGTNGTRAVLLTAWQGASDAQDALLKRVPELWTTEIAALAFLRAGNGPWAVHADPSSGAVSVLVTEAGRTAARVLVEDASSPARFRLSAARAVAETCAGVGAAAPPRESGPLVLDPRAVAHLRGTVGGMPEGREWLQEYGIALGAALAASSPDPLARGLASLSASPPARRLSHVHRGVTWLAKPRNAWATIAACIALLLLGPLAFAAARLAVLEARSAGLADQAKQRADERLRAAMYDQLRTSRWPMSKLLADVSAAAPVGVVANTILLSPEQGVSVQGTAQSPEQVNTFQANLNGTRLFSAVKVGRVSASSSGVDFELSATLSNPHGKAAGAEDFAAKPLAVRRYGEGASNTAAPRSDTPAPAARAPNRPARRVDVEEEPAERPASSRESRRPEPSGSKEPPERLTSEAIQAMSFGKASLEWASRKRFLSTNQALDAETKSRLQDEIAKLNERMNATRGGGG